jgi:hypothetical protein
MSNKRYELRIGNTIERFDNPIKAYWALFSQRNHPEGPPEMTTVYTNH